ncbi:hypothetical protein SFUMM280S_01489 [Streptomyces fumanus]
MNISTTTATAIQGLKWYADTPAMDRTSSTSPGAYATEDSGSEAKTGRATRFGRSVSPSRSLRSARPMRIRLGTSVSLDTTEDRKRSNGGPPTRHPRSGSPPPSG